MKGWVAAWQTMRILKWGFWIGTMAFSIYFVSDRAPHMTPFGNLTRTTELLMFGLPGAAVAAGLFELMFRERAVGKPEVRERDQLRRR